MFETLELSPMGTACRLQHCHDVLSKEDQYAVLARQGFEFPGVEVRIIVEDGTPSPKEGKNSGELQVRGAWVINLSPDRCHFICAIIPIDCSINISYAQFHPNLYWMVLYCIADLL
jgi:hypothetical protein